MRGRGARLRTEVVLVMALTAVAPRGAETAPARKGGTDAKDSKDGKDAAPAPERIQGAVLEYRSERPSIGRVVIVGKARTTTDVDGRFAIAAPPGVYDLTVVDPGRYSVTFYRGLRRRDPVLIHAGDINLVPEGHERHAAHVDGRLSGGGFDPVASPTAMVHFFSPQAAQDRTLGGQGHDARRGGFGPLPLYWIGPPSITGTLLAVRAIPERTDGGATGANLRGPKVWWEAHREITVASGEVVKADLAFTRLAMGRIAGRIDVDPDVRVLGRGIIYRFPHGAIGLDGAGLETGATPFDFPVPDLRHLPGQYCADAYDGTRGKFCWVIKCGVAFGATDVALELRAPPKLNIAHHAILSRDTRFAWTLYEPGAVHRLAIECDGGPNVFVYTTATSTSWPDLGAVGLPFPRPGETCAVSVTGFGPHPGMDGAFSPDGITSWMPKEAYSSRSLEPFVTIGAPGKRAGAKPPRQAVEGDGPPGR